MRQTVSVKGARENNLQNVEVEIPRNQLVIVTGISGSGKSSLAFDTVYAEGQRRFLESMSTYAKRFITQLKKPDVDFIDGLSPVVSIEQKTVSTNPRSTVGTMTDLQDYLRMLFAIIGVAHCPYCEGVIPIRSHHQILERMLSMPEGTEVEIHAPVFKIYGEDYDYLFDDIRTKGCRHVRIDGIEHDISEEIELDPDQEYDIQVIVDKFFIKKDIDRQVLASLEHTMLVGEGFMRFDVEFPEDADADAIQLLEGFGCPKHGVLMAELGAHHFTFNEPTGACVTCSGLGTYLQVHPKLLVPDKSRSIADGAFVHQAFNYDPDRWDGRTMYSLAAHYGFDLNAPFADLPEEILDILYHGTHGEEFPIQQPEGAQPIEKRHLSRKIRFDGIINRIDRHYRNYRKRGRITFRDGRVSPKSNGRAHLSRLWWC